MTSRLWAYGFSAALLLLVASPLFGAFANDSFPVSTYPMFASARGREVSIPYASAITADGEVLRVPPRAVANDEVIQSFETIRQAIRFGPEALDALCHHIGGNMEVHGAVRIRILTGTYDAVSYFHGDKDPIAEHLHTECEVD